MTHIIVDKRDDSRRVELMKRTSRCLLLSSTDCIVLMSDSSPKHRHVIISEYISACLEEKTLLDEDGRHIGFRFVCGFTEYYNQNLCHEDEVAEWDCWVRKS